jgi:hypothetical protein
MAAIDPTIRTSTVTDDSKHKTLSPSTRILSPASSRFFEEEKILKKSRRNQLS